MPDDRMLDVDRLDLAELDPARPELFREDLIWACFARLRREAPVHRSISPDYGPYWSICRYDDIVAIEKDVARFSSDAAHGGVTIVESTPGAFPPMFIAMDPPEHGAKRRTIAPAFAGPSLAALEPVFRTQIARILDALPVDEEIDWTERVATPLAGQALATLLGYPHDRAWQLTRWADVATTIPGADLIDTAEQWHGEMAHCLAAFQDLWRERRVAAPAGDPLSLLAHGDATGAMSDVELLGTAMLLVVGGTDTTRHSITGSVKALAERPAQLAALRADPGLMRPMIDEAIRWQTPLTYMRRTATEDVDFRGQRIARGDKVVLWYLSANRDAAAIEEPDTFSILRPRASRHLAFGTGIHRCIGQRMAELQLRLLWEELLARFDTIELPRPAEKLYSVFVHGYRRLPVLLRR